MKDALHDFAVREVYTPIRKCEWCHGPAQRGLELCLPCEKRWTLRLEVPKESGCEAECILGLHRAVGVLW